MKGDTKEKRANWITKILEHDIDVRPTKVIRGKRLCEYIAQESEPREVEVDKEEVVMFTYNSSEACWLEDRKHFMRTGVFLEGLPPEKRRFYMMQNSGFCLVKGVLFKINFDGVLLRCVDQA